jgi:hypothetical protein
LIILHVGTCGASELLVLTLLIGQSVRPSQIMEEVNLTLDSLENFFSMTDSIIIHPNENILPAVEVKFLWLALFVFSLFSLWFDDVLDVPLQESG